MLQVLVSNLPTIKYWFWGQFEDYQIVMPFDGSLKLSSMCGLADLSALAPVAQNGFLQRRMSRLTVMSCLSAPVTQSKLKSYMPAVEQIQSQLMFLQIKETIDLDCNSLGSTGYVSH